MSRFFFSDGSGRLYGAYEPPLAGAVKGDPVLLCYPFGQEQVRCHMAFRQLARQLTRLGQGVLRFDYHGTGDSAGRLETADLEVWIQNTRAAVEELKSLAGAASVSVVGLRLGAAVAARAVAGRRDVRALVMWDPVLDGDRFLGEMADKRSAEKDGAWWVHGFPLGPKFRDSLGNLRLCDTPPVGGHVTVMEIRSRHEENGGLLREAWKSGVSEYHEVQTSDQGNWNYMDAVGGILLPHETVRSIAQWLGRSGRG